MFSHGLSCICAAVVASAIGFADSALADVTISAGQTQNMTCNAGVCVPTAADAVLGVGDLEEMLKAGNVSISTTGSDIQANNIVVASKFSWKSSSGLTFDAYQSITFDAPVTAKGKTSVGLLANDGGTGGTLSFGTMGKFEFRVLSSALSINGATFALVNSVFSLGKSISANPSGNFALATDYDASRNRTYNTAPIRTPLTGTVQGLGNAISNLKADFSRRKKLYAGVFEAVLSTGSVQNLRLVNEQAYTEKGTGWGGLVGVNYGLLFNDSVTGIFQAGNCLCVLGGLAVGSQGQILNSSTNVNISAPTGYGAGLVSGNGGQIIGSRATGLIYANLAGGLVVYNLDSIDQSYASATVSGGDGTVLGGLVGVEEGVTTNSYATGSVSGGDDSSVGGLVGKTTTQTYSSYSTGVVSGTGVSLVGGFVGDDSKAIIQNSYWDTTTSGTEDGTGEGNVFGLTGLNTEQLQSGLPAGFDPAIWAQDANINNGFPYLIANPPVDK